MNNLIKSGTIGGSICSILPQINSSEIIKTIVLAVVGTLVSYGCAHALKKWTKSKED